MMATDYSHIVEGCRRRDRVAQRQLYDAMAPMAMGVCMRYVRNREEAQDLMQEGFVRVFEHMGQLRDASKLPAWVRKVMVNECLHHFRRQHLTMVTADAGDIDRTEQPLDPFADEEVVLALQQLPPQQQVVFNLVAVEEYAYDEAAQLLRCSEVNVRALYSRARSRLRGILGGDKS